MSDQSGPNGPGNETPAHRRSSLSDLGLGDDVLPHPSAGTGDTNTPRLRPVPDETNVDRRSPVARWVLTLSEPLLSTNRRIQADEEMAKFIGSNSQWACFWFAGFMCDVVSTLPPDDPWRLLSSRIDLSAISIGEPGTDADTVLSWRNPQGAAAPETGTGSVFPDGRRFGSERDSDDLVMPDLGEADVDMGLVALAEELDDLASGVAGFATSNVEAFADALAKIYHHIWLADYTGESAVPTGVRFLNAVAPALRRFIHRRRIYLGQDDPFVNIAGFAWMARADRLVGGTRRISAELGLAREAQIDPGAYRDMRL